MSLSFHVCTHLVKSDREVVENGIFIANTLCLRTSELVPVECAHQHVKTTRQPWPDPKLFYDYYMVILPY